MLLKPQGNVFKSVCQDLIDAPEKVTDIISFCENEVWGLGYTLRPVQKFILKCFYGLPLDHIQKGIEVTDKFRERVLYYFTEREYFDFLVSEGRTNQETPPAQPFNELELVIGRRGTKSTTASFVSVYEAYKLLKKANPQTHYQILDVDDIRITNVANSIEQATKLFKLIRGSLEKADFFKRFISVPPGETQVKMVTAADLEQYGPNAVPSIKLTVGSCNARAIRGGACIVVVMDEEAHFINNFGNRSDTEIYEALTPSVADFGLDGKILNMSSPLNKAGKFYDTYMQSFSDPDILMLQIPSWESNPMLTPKYLKSKYRRDPDRYMMEFGAQFSEAANAYIEDHDKLRPVVTDRPYLDRGSRQKRYFFGIDLGLVNDGTGISVGHVEWEQRWVTSEAEKPEGVIDAEVGRPVKVPVVHHDLTIGLYSGAPPYEDKDVLLLEDVVDKIVELSRHFPLQAGLIDQWCGEPLKQALKRHGLTKIELVSFTQKLNSEVYTTLKTLYLAKQVSIAGGWDSELVQELLTLEKTILSNYLISVEAPQVRGYHDDRSDSFARMVWLAFTQGVGAGSRVSIASSSNGETLRTASGAGRLGTFKSLKRRREMYQGRLRPLIHR